MRKLILAAMGGTLAIAGCSQDNTPTPMEPSSETPALHCFQPGFPLKLALEQIAGSRTTTALYPKSNPRRLALALARVSEIAALWTFCKPDLARTKLTQHSTILMADLRAGNRLVGGSSDATEERVTTHINTMWQGVFGGAGTNAGSGLYTGEELTVPTANGNGAVRVPAGGYGDEPTSITILQRSSDDNPFDDDPGNPPVFSPFFEIIASNAINRPYLVNGLRATVAICVDDEVDPGILGLDEPAIAHIAVENVDDPENEPGGFEILDFAPTGDIEGFVCEFEEFNSLFDGGLKGFASAAPRYLRETAASLFLPAEARAAAAAAVGKTGLGGLARSLSPFGVTERFGFEFELTGDPQERFFDIGDNPDLKWDCEGDFCSYPAVVVLDGEVGVEGVEVTVELLPLEGSDGVFDEGSITEVTTNSSGEAVFDDLSVTEPGDYRLRFEADGVSPLETNSFTVFFGE